MLTGKPPSLSHPFPLLFLSTFFPSLFKKNLKLLEGGGAEPPEPPLEYALDVTIYQSAYFNDQNSLTKYHSSINYGC